MDFSKVYKVLSWNEIPPEFFSSIITLLILAILAIVIHIKLKNYDPLKKPNGFLHLVEISVEFADKQVSDLMGPVFEGFGGYVLFLACYIFIGFLVGMLGFPNVFQPNRLPSSIAFSPLPNPFTNLAMPLSIALMTFGLTHFTAMKYKKWHYFHRYIEPLPFFLPINLITMWSSVLSLTLRLFGNALAGFCVITLIYSGFAAMSPSGVGLVATPFVASISHLYFDLFDGFIQLTVFCMLTMINISGEYISPETLKAQKEDKINAKLERKQNRELKRRQKLEKKEGKVMQQV